MQRTLTNPTLMSQSAPVQSVPYQPPKKKVQDQWDHDVFLRSEGGSGSWPVEQQRCSPEGRESLLDYKKKKIKNKYTKSIYCWTASQLANENVLMHKHSDKTAGKNFLLTNRVLQKQLFFIFVELKDYNTR